MSQWPQTHSVEITPWGKKFILSSNAKRWPNDWHFSFPPRSASSRHESRRTRMEISSSQPHLFAPIKLLLFFRLSHPALNSTRPQKFCLMSIGSPFDCCDASYTGAAVELNVESPKGCRKVRVGSCHSSRSSRLGLVAQAGRRGRKVLRTCFEESTFPTRDVCAWRDSCCPCRILTKFRSSLLVSLPERVADVRKKKSCRLVVGVGRPRHVGEERCLERPEARIDVVELGHWLLNCIPVDCEFRAHRRKPCVQTRTRGERFGGGQDLALLTCCMILLSRAVRSRKEFY